MSAHHVTFVISNDSLDAPSQTVQSNGLIEFVLDPGRTEDATVRFEGGSPFRLGEMRLVLSRSKPTSGSMLAINHISREKTFTFRVNRGHGPVPKHPEHGTELSGMITVTP